MNLLVTFFLVLFILYVGNDFSSAFGDVISWDDNSYLVGDVGHITVVDSIANTSELFYDFVSITVSSDSGGKLSFLLVETGPDTGIYSGSVLFGDITRENKEIASIKVMGGDTIFATYDEFKDTAQIKIFSDILDDITLEDPTIVFTNEIKILEDASSPDCKKSFTCFSPSSISVPPMTVVVWENLDSLTHSIRSGSSVDGSDGLFAKTNFYSNDKFTYIFKEEGTFQYYCWIHPWMQGKIIVEETTNDTFDENSFSSPLQNADDLPDWFKLVTQWYNEDKISIIDYQNAFEFLSPNLPTVSLLIHEPKMQEVTETNIRSLFPKPFEYGSDWRGQFLDTSIEGSGYQQLKNYAHTDWVEARVNMHLYYEIEYALQHFEDMIYSIPSYSSPISELPYKQSCYGYKESVTYGITTVLFCTYENVVVEIHVSSGDPSYLNSTSDALLMEQTIRKNLS